MQSASRFEEATVTAERRALLVGVVTLAVLALVVAVVVAVLVAALSGIAAGLVILAAGAAAWVLLVRSQFATAADRVLAGVPDAPLAEVDAPRWHNALSGVALLTGVKVPSVRVVDVPVANAMVVSDQRSSTVVVTAGLLDGAGPVELEVLAAELLCRVRDGSARFTTLTAGLPTWLGRVAGLTAARAVELFGDQRSSRLDIEAVTVTSYPPGLISALDRMARLGTQVPGAASSTAALWIAQPVADPHNGDDTVNTKLHQPLDYRIAVLQEL